jgi:RNA-directed DNA polymerase
VTWVYNRYWPQGETGRAFATAATRHGQVSLTTHSAVPIVRHIKVPQNRSPYDGDWVYWSTRRGQYPTVSPRLAYLLKRQRGHCALCRLFFQHDDQLEIDHISGDHRDSRYANLQAIHGHCHDAKTRANGEYLPVGVRDKHQGTEERSARKRARSVLEQREVERSASRL